MKYLRRSAFFVIFSLMSYTSFAQSQITFYTSMGDFVVEMYDTITPVTSGNFIDLVEQKFYDGVIFHRVIDDFMIQGGDPTGTGYGGPGYTIQDEFDSSLSNIQKTISMANSGPNTGGSQFFINLVNNTYLDFDKPPYASQHPVFGIVISNFSVVQAIGKVPVDSTKRPTTPVVMDSVRVTKKYMSGIKEQIGNAADIQIYPNLLSDKSILSINAKNGGKVDIALFSVTGSLIGKHSTTIAAGTNQVPASKFCRIDLRPGIYWLTLTQDASTVSRKMIVVQ